MSQISPPIRIVLIAVIGLIASWMLFLRPKTEDVPAPTPAPATAPGVTGLSKAVDKAKGASATSDKANEKLQQATGEGKKDAVAGKAGAKQGSATNFVTGRELPLEPLTAAQTKGLPKPVIRALNERKVLVVGVFDTKEQRWARMATDDRRVRGELAKTNRYKGQVVVATSSLGELFKLNAVIGGLSVSQTPSVVVVDRNRQGVVLNGFVERNAINQAIADARRNSTEVRITDPFVRQLNRTCANLYLRMDRLNAPTNKAQIAPALRKYESLMASYGTAFASLKGKSKYRPIAKQMSGVLVKAEGFGSALRSGNFAKMESSLNALLAADNGLDRKFANAGASSCVVNRKS